jgi:hypothetical protein
MKKFIACLLLAAGLCASSASAAVNISAGADFLSQTNQPPTGASALSMCAWVNITSLNINNFNVLWWRNAAAINEFIVFVDLGRIKYEDDNGGNTYSANSTYTLGVPGFLCWTRSGTTNLVYWNGTQVISSTTVANMTSPTSNWILGGDGAGTNGSSLQGWFDSVRVWTVTLTPTEVLAEMWHRRAVTNRGSLYFEGLFLNKSDPDTSGNARNFTVTGSTTVGGGPVGF